jgi:hypothetical protein
VTAGTDRFKSIGIQSRCVASKNNVQKTSKKQLSIYRDVAQGKADIVVICSNDSDLVPAVKVIQADFPECIVGIVAPLHEPNGNPHRRGNTELEKLAHWTRHYIRDEELAKSQLSDVVPTRKKASRKPPHW